MDGISLHNYYGNTESLKGNSTERYLAMNLDMERQIQEVSAVCDYVPGTLKSQKRLWLFLTSGTVTDRCRGCFAHLNERVKARTDAPIFVIPASRGS